MAMFWKGHFDNVSFCEPPHPHICKVKLCLLLWQFQSVLSLLQVFSYALSAEDNTNFKTLPAALAVSKCLVFVTGVLLRLEC